MELESEYGLDIGCEPEVDLDYKWGLDPDLVYAQPQLTQLVE